MEKKRFFIFSLVCVLSSLLWCGCKKTLELKPLNAFSEEDVWHDPKLAQVFVNSIYDQSVLAYKDGGLGWAAQTDELYSNFNWMNENLYVRGEATPDNQADATLNDWNTLYVAVRYCNTFMTNIGVMDTVGNGESIRRMNGEVYFLRALTYFELLKRFGGVPLITKVYDVNDKVFDEKRATWDETRDFILADIDQAVKGLPASYSNSNDKGRATIGAALALKSRLLLYAASPYYNKVNDVQRWRDAKAAAKAVIDNQMYTLYGNAANGTYNKVYLDFFNPKGDFRSCLQRFG